MLGWLFPNDKESFFAEGERIGDELSFEWPFFGAFPTDGFAGLAAVFPARDLVVFDLTIGFQYGFLRLASERGASDG